MWPWLLVDDNILTSDTTRLDTSFLTSDTTRLDAFTIWAYVEFLWAPLAMAHEALDSLPGFPTILAWFVFEKIYIKDKIQNAQSRRSGEKSHHIYTTYKNTVMPHGCHIYAKASDMANAKICAYPQSYHTLPHWKYVLRCRADCPWINIPDKETTKKHE